MKKALFPALLLLLLTGHLWAQQTKLPVFFMKYDYGLATEEEEDEEDLEQTSNKHRVSLRIKEQFTKRLIMNLYFIFYLKDYTEQTSNNYHYFILNPDLSVKFTEKLKWYMAFKTKWVLYDEPDTQGLSKDYNSFSFKTNLTYRTITQLSFIPSFQGIYDVYENKDKSKQTYNFGLSILSKIKSFILGAKYKGIIRLDLGGESTVTTRFNNEFGVSLTFDPNKLRDKKD